MSKRNKESIKAFEKSNSMYLRKTKRVETSELSVSERIKNLDVEDVLGLEGGGVEMEANRCLNCGCMAVNLSDTAPALIVLDAKIKTTKRVIGAGEFFAAEAGKTTTLDSDEIVTEIQVPMPSTNTRNAFIKFAQRGSIDFPIVNCAAAITSEGGTVSRARICLNAVHNIPYRVAAAEDFIVGKSIDEATAEAAGNAAVTNAIPTAQNEYKVQIARVLVKRCILACK